MNEIVVNIDRAIQLTRQHVFFFDNVDPIRNQVHPELRDDGRFNNVNNRLAQVEARIRNFQTTVVGLLQRYEQADNVLLNNEITRVRDMQSQILLAWVSKFNQARHTAEFGNRQIVRANLDSTNNKVRDDARTFIINRSRDGSSYFSEMEIRLNFELAQYIYPFNSLFEALEAEHKSRLGDIRINDISMRLATAELWANEFEPMFQRMNISPAELRDKAIEILRMQRIIYQNRGDKNRINAIDAQIEKYQNISRHISRELQSERDQAFVSSVTMVLGFLVKPILKAHGAYAAATAFSVYKRTGQARKAIDFLGSISDESTQNLLHRQRETEILWYVDYARYSQIVERSPVFTQHERGELNALTYSMISNEILIISIERELELRRFHEMLGELAPGGWRHTAQKVDNFDRNNLPSWFSPRMINSISEIDRLDQMLIDLHSLSSAHQSTSVFLNSVVVMGTPQGVVVPDTISGVAVNATATGTAMGINITRR